LDVMWLSYAWWITITVVPAVILVGLGMQPEFTASDGNHLDFLRCSSLRPHTRLERSCRTRLQLALQQRGSSRYNRPVRDGMARFTYYLNLIIGGVMMAAASFEKKQPLKTNANQSQANCSQPNQTSARPPTRTPPTGCNHFSACILGRSRLGDKLTAGPPAGRIQERTTYGQVFC